MGCYNAFVAKFVNLVYGCGFMAVPFLNPVVSVGSLTAMYSRT